MNDTLKRYLISSGITFLSAFGLAILPALNDLTFEGLTRAAVFGILFIGIRAGLKGLIEYVVIPKQI